MRSFIVPGRFLFTLVVLAGAPSSRAAEPDAAALDAIVKDALKAWNVPGAAVAVVREDKVAYLKGHGVRDIDSQRPVTPDTIFAIASCSKAFTAASVALLVDEKKMAWDDPVRKHVPFFRLQDPLADAQVTLRDLLCHRTGLSRHDLLGHHAPWDRAEIIRRIGYVKPTTSFRSTWEYQNIMFVTAGFAAGQANGNGWEPLVQKRLFDPLGMKNANFRAADAEKAADHARPHIKKDGKPRVIPWDPIDNCGPAGSINANVRDLCRWLRFQLGDGTFEGKRLLSPEGLQEMHAPQMLIRLEGIEKDLNPETLQKSYGLGWFIQDYRGKHILSHTGGLDGFRCRIVLVPHAKLGIVLLSNSSVGISRASMPVACTYTLVDHLLQLPRKDWDDFYLGHARKAEERQQQVEKKRAASRKKDTHPSHQLADYVGVYNEPAYGRLLIRLDEKNTLRLEWSSFKPTLEHRHFDTFTTKGPEPVDAEDVLFQLDSDGEVATLQFLGVTFKKAPKDR